MRYKHFMMNISLSFFAALAASAMITPSLEVTPTAVIVSGPQDAKTIIAPPEHVLRVVDGDTFLIDAHWSPYKLEWKIRVRGIDTPEKGRLAKCKLEADRSKLASALSKKLIDESNGMVSLRNVKHDKFGGRLDADVILSDGRSLGDELLAAGLARKYNGSGPKPNWCN